MTTPLSDLNSDATLPTDASTLAASGVALDPSAVSTLSACTVIDLPKISDPRGNLTFVEEDEHIPFGIRRVFYLYDVPTGTNRGAHAHRELHQFLICLSGSFDVALDDGRTQRTVHLNRPWQGLHVPPMVWASEINFDPGSVCLVLASDLYDEADYIRDYDVFLEASRARRYG